jgi:hypothetical protein
MGNSNVMNTYSWTDINPIGVSYYRIKQIDFDGKYKVFDPLTLDCDARKDWIKVYPNPTSGLINIELSSGIQFEQPAIYNSVGQFVSNLSSILSHGESIYTADISFLPPGTYYLRMMVNGEWMMRPVILIR